MYTGILLIGVLVLLLFIYFNIPNTFWRECHEMTMRLYARHRPSVRLSVCPSVCPSVCLSVCRQASVHSFLTIFVKLGGHVPMVESSDEFEDGHTRATGC